MTKAKGWKQGELALPTWGGRRRGAGRKPVLGPDGRRLDGHPRHRRVRKRPAISGREPLHVVVRVDRAVGQLRRWKAYRAIRRATLAAFCLGLVRIVHLSIQRTHLHLLVEAADAAALARGMQGFQISAARHLNAEVTIVIGGQRRKRRGQVFVHRYHAEVVDTPRRARHCLAYVLNNWRRHREHLAGPAQRRAAIDPYSSGLCFDGWRDRATPFTFPRGYQPLVVVPAAAWLLTDGWRRWGPIDLREVPGPS